MTIPSGPPPPPGYYPDPGGSGLLRWWHGSAWTEDLVKPAPPIPPFGSLSFDYGTGAAPTTVLGTSIVPTTVSATRRRGPVLVAVAALVVVCLVLSGIGVWRWSAARTKPVDSTAVAAASAPQTPETEGASKVTPAQARSVLQQYWPVHERALVSRDIATLRTLETGAMAAWEPNAVACGCLLVKTVRPLVDTRFFVPRQSAYPVHFAVEAQTSYLGQTWTELLVFNKAAAGMPWLASEDSGFAPLAGRPATLDDPRLTPRDTSCRRPRPSTPVPSGPRARSRTSGSRRRSRGSFRGRPRSSSAVRPSRDSPPSPRTATTPFRPTGSTVASTSSSRPATLSSSSRTDRPSWPAARYARRWSTPRLRAK